MISLKGVNGIKNLCLPERCDVCGKNGVTFGSVCSRCYVWHEWHFLYNILKYFRFSMRKYLYKEAPKPRIIPI
jgi:hypothetical protein